jgi:hypothetical protein
LGQELEFETILDPDRQRRKPTNQPTNQQPTNQPNQLAKQASEPESHANSSPKFYVFVLRKYELMIVLFTRSIVMLHPGRLAAPAPAAAATFIHHRHCNVFSQLQVGRSKLPNKKKHSPEYAHKSRIKNKNKNKNKSKKLYANAGINTLLDCACTENEKKHKTHTHAHTHGLTHTHAHAQRKSKTKSTGFKSNQK